MFLILASTEAISFHVSAVFCSIKLRSFLMISNSFIASFLDAVFQVEWCEYGKSNLLIFLSDPTLAKFSNPVSNKSSKILSTATFVSVDTKILVSVSPTSSSSAEINLMMATSKYDFPHPKAPCTRSAFCLVESLVSFGKNHLMHSFITLKSVRVNYLLVLIHIEVELLGEVLFHWYHNISV